MIFITGWLFSFVRTFVPQYSSISHLTILLSCSAIRAQVCVHDNKINIYGGSPFDPILWGVERDCFLLTPHTLIVFAFCMFVCVFVYKATGITFRVTKKNCILSFEMGDTKRRSQVCIVKRKIIFLFVNVNIANYVTNNNQQNFSSNIYKVLN